MHHGHDHDHDARMMRVTTQVPTYLPTYLPSRECVRAVLCGTASLNMMR